MPGKPHETSFPEETFTVKDLFGLNSCRIPDDHKDAYETGLAENRTSPS